MIDIDPIVLGKLGASYGTCGWLRIFSLTEHTEDIFDYKPWFIQSSGQWRQVKLEAWKYHNKNSIIKIKHINDRNAANLITNYEIFIDSTQLPILKDNEYYWKDLINCKVITIEGYSLGHVQYLIETGSNDILVIKANLEDTFGIKERLLPFLYEQVIKNINLTIKTIEVDWDPNF
ncbi:MAG: ribosome maturation factor RimM [Arsenophonus sp. ER-BJ3-MAG3]